MWTTEHGGTLGRYEKCPSPQSTVVEEEECYMNERHRRKISKSREISIQAQVVYGAPNRQEQKINFPKMYYSQNIKNQNQKRMLRARRQKDQIIHL